MTEVKNPGIQSRITELESRLQIIRGKQKQFRDWERSRRPIRIGFLIAIPLVLVVEGLHFYLSLRQSQGPVRAPWLMALIAASVGGLSWLYYNQAKLQRDKVLKGLSRAGEVADQIERQLVELRKDPAGDTRPTDLTQDR